MNENPSPSEVVKLLAKVLCGLQVPVSMSMSFEGKDEWCKLHDLTGFGWKGPQDYEEGLNNLLLPQTK